MSDARADGPAGPLHEQGVLAEPRGGVLHVRVPADVPRDLHRAARERDGRPRERERVQPVDRTTSASMAAFAIITACYTNLAISVTFQRDAGILKRTRGTPLPAERLPGGARDPCDGHVGPPGRDLRGVRDGSSTTRRSRPASSWSGSIVVVLVGSASFAALGLALTPAIPNADAAPPVVNATILPAAVHLGHLHPHRTDAPQWIETVGEIFPVRHLVRAVPGLVLRAASSSSRGWTSGSSRRGGSSGLFLATRFFSWEPRT